jgi:hypothetical protein
MLESTTQNNDRDVRRFKPVFHEKDKFNHPGQFLQRRFKNPMHFVHNLIDLLRYTPDLIRVYFGRAISPRFREMIMLTVASTNDCSA